MGKVFEISKGGWLRGVQPNTGRLAYFSHHNKVQHNGFILPYWMIVKEENGYMLYMCLRGEYTRLIGFMHHKLLRDVKFYCDVEVEKFKAGIY